MMKKILMICAAMMAVMIFASCNKDNEELIVGKWRIHSLEGIAATGGTINDGSGDAQTDEIVYVDSWGWVFNADGTGYAYQIVDGRENVTGQFNYSINDETLHMSYVDYHIEKLNRNKLRLSDKVNITDVDGNHIRYEYGYLNFRRQ